MLGVNYDKAAVRRTRQQIADKVRNDWEDVLQHGMKWREQVDELDAENQILPPTNATEWRERTYASSDPSEAEETEAEESSSSTSPALRRTSTNGSRAFNSRRAFHKHHCMYPDGSDADGDSSTDSLEQREALETRKRQERKRRRRRRLEAEMAWNDGLRNFEQTRDIWCRAKRVPIADKCQPEDSASNASDMPSSPETAPTSAATSVDHEHSGENNIGLAISTDKAPCDMRNSQPSPTYFASSLHEASISRPITALLPVPPPLIPPTDPGRQNITNQYGLIFNKVVTEGLKPQVPINLSHMAPALVKGWKDSDEWPPKPSTTLTEQPAASKKGKSQHKGDWWTQRQRERKGTLEGLKEGGRRLLGLGSSSPPERTAAKDETASDSKKSKKGATPRTSPKTSPEPSPKTSPQLKSTKGRERENSPMASTPTPASPRNSNEHESPLKMRKNVKRLSRRMIDSIGGGSEEIGTGEEKG